MPFTPTTLRKSGRPRQPFSHEQILQVCYFYKNLLSRSRGIQTQIDNAIATFQHHSNGRPTESLIIFLKELSNIDADLRGPLLDEIMQVELAIIKWEGKSAKLKSEARRQARLRFQRGGEAPTNEVFPDEFDCPSSTNDPFTEAASDHSNGVISPTMALAQCGMAQLPDTSDGHPAEAPTNESYKKSGLI